MEPTAEPALVCVRCGRRVGKLSPGIARPYHYEMSMEDGVGAQCRDRASCNRAMDKEVA